MTLTSPSTLEPPLLRLSREAELLLLASAGELGQDRFQQLARAPLDWERLTTLAHQFRATSTLWCRLQRIPDFHPGPYSARLQSLGVINEFRLRHVRKLLEEVVDLLAGHDIELMLLKGAALLVGGTTRPLERSMSDLDLVVVTGSADEAWRLCREAGWTLRYPDTAQQYEGHHHLPRLVDPDGVGLGLEVHRALFPGGGIALGVDERATARRARLFPVGSTTVRVPTLEDLLVHACIHFAWGHSFHRHGWSTFSDAHAIVADPGFSWVRFLQLARGTPFESCCYWTLRLARAGAKLPVPQDVLDALARPRARWLEVALEHHLFGLMFDPAVETLPVGLQRFFWQLAVRPRQAGLGHVRPWLLPSPRTLPDNGAGTQQNLAPGNRWRRSMVALRYLIGLIAPATRRRSLAN